MTASNRIMITLLSPVTNIIVLVVLLPTLILYSAIPVAALKLSAPLKSCLEETLSIDRIRLDGALETKEKELYLPLLPVGNKTNSKKISLKAVFPSQGTPEFLFLSN